MDISKEAFNDQFREGMDALIEQMAEHPDVELKKFYGMACFLENLAFFSPVLYDLIEKSKK